MTTAKVVVKSGWSNDQHTLLPWWTGFVMVITQGLPVIVTFSFISLSTKIKTQLLSFLFFPLFSYPSLTQHSALLLHFCCPSLLSLPNNKEILNYLDLWDKAMVFIMYHAFQQLAHSQYNSMHVYSQINPILFCGIVATVVINHSRAPSP